MDTVVELTAIFRMPLLWCAFFLCVGSGLLAFASPRFLKELNATTLEGADLKSSNGLLGMKIHADHFLLKHARLFGACALTTAVVLFYQIA